MCWFYKRRMANEPSDQGKQSLSIEGATRDLALRRYDIIIKYVIYENTVYWTRNQFFGVSNFALLAFFAAIYDEAKVALPIIPVLGVSVSAFWIVSAREARHWMRRWEGICSKLEPQAFEEIKLFRESQPHGGSHIYMMAEGVAFVSVAAWLLGLSFLIVPRIWAFISS